MMRNTTGVSDRPEVGMQRVGPAACPLFPLEAYENFSAPWCLILMQ